MKKLVAILLLLITISHVYGQQLEKCDSVNSFWIIEKDKTIYTLKITGKVTTTERENVISIDDYALQYLVVDKEKYENKGKEETELEILVNYVSSEINYMSAQYKTTLETQALQAPLTSKKDVIVWWYKMPEGLNEQVSSQIFASIIIDDKIFGVGSPQFNDQKLEDIRDFLMDILSTLRKVDKKKDLQNICNKKTQQEIMQEELEEYKKKLKED